MRKMRISFVKPLASAAVGMVLAGCGGGQPTAEIIPTVPAEGVLSYQGNPLEFHEIVVIPEGERPAIGVSDEQGRFALGTNDVGDGAVVGTHPVAVRYVGPPSTDPEEGVMKFTPPPPPKVKIDRKYHDPTTSGITVAIPEKGDTDLKIDLK